MPALTYPDQATIDTWELGSRDVRGGQHPTEVYRVDEATWGAKWFCKYDKRFEVVDWLIGQSAIYDDNGTTRLSRLLPRTAPDRPKLIITQVTGITGHKNTGDRTAASPPPPPLPPAGQYRLPPTPNYDRAEITALYEFATFPLLEDSQVSAEIDRFVSFPDSTEPAGEFLQLPSTANLYYHAIPGSVQAGSSIDNTPIVSNQYGRVMVQEAFTATWHMLPEDTYQADSNLWNRIYGTGESDTIPYQGCINSAEIFGRPVGTVLFHRVRPRRQANPTATGFWWTLEYELVYKPSGWNWLYGWASGLSKSGWYWVGPKDSEIQYANALADDASLYNARDLSLLFSVGAS